MKEALQIKMDNIWFPTTGEDDKVKNDKTNNINLQEVILKSVTLGYTNDNQEFLITSNNNEECSITSNGTFASDIPAFQKNILGDSEEFKEMDNNDLIIKLIEKVEQSNQQIKIDLNESEKRITADRRESEKRITEERRLSEERMEKKFTEAMSSFKQLNDKMDINNTQLNTKIDTTAKESNDKIDINNKYINNISVTTMIGIAAIAVALIVALFAFIYTSKQSSIPKATSFNYTINYKNI